MKLVTFAGFLICICSFSLMFLATYLPMGVSHLAAYAVGLLTPSAALLVAAIPSNKRLWLT